MNATAGKVPAGTPASPYGERWTRWIKPAVIALLLVVFDEQGVFAFLGGVFLILIYLPRSILAAKYRSCRKDRLIRLAIYLGAVVVVFGLRAFNTDLARERAERIIAAAESYKAANGRYPERLEQLVPRFIPEIPAKAKLTLLDNGFSYHAATDNHTLMYVFMPPFGRRYYQFESKTWRDLD